MELDNHVYELLGTVNWFAHCGQRPALTLSLAYDFVPDRSLAISSVLGDHWLDARTEARGKLTGFLASHDYDAYGHWNELARASRRRLEQGVLPHVRTALVRIDAEALAESIRLDLSLFALFSAYRRQLSRAPNFFAELFLVYQAGHLPCGWKGDLDDWPAGSLLIY